MNLIFYENFQLKLSASIKWWKEANFKFKFPIAENGTGDLPGVLEEACKLQSCISNWLRDVEYSPYLDWLTAQLNNFVIKLRPGFQLWSVKMETYNNSLSGKVGESLVADIWMKISIRFLWRLWICSLLEFLFATKIWVNQILDLMTVPTEPGRSVDF